MTINRVKLGSAVTFMKCLLAWYLLVILAKTFTWNKTMFPASNSLHLPVLVVNEPTKSIYKDHYQYSFAYSIYHCLM